MPGRLGISVAVLAWSVVFVAPMGCGSAVPTGADGAAGAMGEADAMGAVPETGDAAASETVQGCGAAIAESTPTVCSTAGATHAELMVHNTCGALTIEMFWVNYQCAEMTYGTVAPGQTFVNNSWVSHPWRLRDAATHALLREIPPLEAPTDVTYP